MCNDYDSGGLRMIDPAVYAQAQKMTWVAKFLDSNYSNTWKHIEQIMLLNFYEQSSVLWKANAPGCVLNKLKNSQLVETLKVWYIYREGILKDLGLSNFHIQDSIWWNKNVSLKHKPFFFLL